MKTILIIIGIAVVLGLIAFLIFGLNPKVTQNATTKDRPVPQSNWTVSDWLANGYTQNEIDVAKNLQSGLNFNPFA